jgi:tetratricopeptide (TPR) repeat protein
MKARLTVLAGLLLGTLTAQAAVDSLSEASRFMESGNYRAAAERLRASAPFPKEQVKGRFLYATALAGAGEREKAAEMFESLIADFPDRPEPYNNLAALYAAQGQLEKAKEVLERGMRTSPSYSAVHDNLSAVYVEMARASYAKALRVNEAAHTPSLQLLYGMNGVQTVEPVVVAAADPVVVEPRAAPAAAKPALAAPAPAAPAAVEAKPAVPPVAAKPVPAPVPPVAAARPPAAAPAAPVAPGPAANPQAAILATLQDWTRVWSARDVEGYLGFYAADFKPVRQSRAQWVSERRERLGNAQSITVTLEEPKVQMTGANRAIVNVVQQYSSSSYSDRTRKQLVLVKVGERWLISSEKTLGVLR